MREIFDLIPPEEKPQEKIPEEEISVEIPPELWEDLEIIARIVGSDFRMEIKLGQPGQGSFFNKEDGSITLDPLHIKESPEQAKFVAAHEGAHRAITLGPKEIDLTERQIRDLYGQIGFGYLQNVIEDPAVNDWMRERFPGLREYTQRAYDTQLREENAVLVTPEVERIIAQLGYCPRFIQYGSEVIRYWHQGRFSQELDPAVERALQRTIEYAMKSIKTIPDPQRPPQRKEIVSKARERFDINTNDIWPEVKKLVEMDLHTEEIRQMMRAFRQKQAELEQKRKELEEAKAKGDQKRQEELQGEIKGLEADLELFNDLPEDIREEFKEKIEEAIREAVEKLSKEMEEREERIKEARKRQQELEEEIKELEEQAKEAIGEEKESLERQIQEKKAEKLSQEIKQKQAEEELEAIQDTLEQIQSSQEMPYPEDKLSDKIKQELEKLFRRLPQTKQKELNKGAKRQLEDLEDEINEELQGKLNEDKPENHKQRRQREEEERKAEEKRKKEEEARAELEDRIERLRKERMTDYDKVYEEVADVINALYIRLKNFFLPTRHPRWKGGYSDGQRVDLDKAMEAEVKPESLFSMWERKTIPRRIDYRFLILVDTSGSMQGEKIEETFKGLVVLAETLEKLGIQYEIIAFSNSSQVFKGWREKLNREKREYLSQIKTFGGGGTNTTAATARAYEDFLGNLGRDNFLITLTDGQPNDSISLKQLLQRIEEEGRIKLVGIGLGPDTEFVGEFYKAAFSIPQVKVDERKRRQGQKDFVEAFVQLLEDMVLHPEKY